MIISVLHTKRMVRLVHVVQKMITLLVNNNRNSVILQSKYSAKLLTFTYVSCKIPKLHNGEEVRFPPHFLFSRNFFVQVQQIKNVISPKFHHCQPMKFRAYFAFLAFNCLRKGFLCVFLPRSIHRRNPHEDYKYAQVGREEPLPEQGYPLRRRCIPDSAFSLCALRFL